MSAFDLQNMLRALQNVKSRRPRGEPMDQSSKNNSNNSSKNSSGGLYRFTRMKRTGKRKTINPSTGARKSTGPRKNR